MNNRAAAPEGILQIREVACAVIDCRWIIHEHAAAAAVAGAVPIIGADVAAEVLIAATMVHRILDRFGLTRKQVAAMDLALKMAVMQSIRQHSGVIVGRIVTSDLLATLVARSGTSFVTRRVARFVPFIGTAVSAGIGYAAMRVIGNSVLNECLRVHTEVTAPTMPDAGRGLA